MRRGYALLLVAVLSLLAVACRTKPPVLVIDYRALAECSEAWCSTAGRPAGDGWERVTRQCWCKYDEGSD